jgi:uncharacterized membrane-anchored protein
MPRVPLLIGVSGKRKFDDSDPNNDSIVAERTRERFKTIFAKLDEDYPDTPKIVLMGAAFGADLIAAHAALERYDNGNTGWAVVALLPFEQDEFWKDFDQDPDGPAGADWAARYQTHRDDFERLLKKARETPAALVCELPKLLVEPQVKGQPRLELCTLEDLVRVPGQPNTQRDEHYEQVGQFIAESATIMIAVTKANESADTDQATGGTNRVVAYRRAGHADEIGTIVARKSEILRKNTREPIVPPARFVWLLDPYDASTRFTPGGYPVQPLAPFSSHSIVDSYANATKANEHADTEHQNGHEQPDRQITVSLGLARAFDRFNRQQKSGVAADISGIAPEALTNSLAEVTDAISRTQVSTNRWSRWGFWAVAGLFVAAIFIFETFAKFFTKNPVAIGLYLLTLILIGLVIRTARANLWQAVSEDYRAVAEMLRVQHAWWAAGLNQRVDREHLQGADRDLSPVRFAATTIVAWLLVRRGWAEPWRPDWNAVRGAGRTARHIPLSHDKPRPWIVTRPMALLARLRGKKQADPTDWIGDQLSYFARKAPDREDKVHITDAASWTLFLASGFLGVIIFLLLAETKIFGTHGAYHVLEMISLSRDGFRGAALVFWGLSAWAAICWRVRKRDIKGLRGLKLSFAIGLLTALLIALALTSIAPALAAYFKLDEPVAAAKSAMVVWLVGLSAIAGAWRYLTERLNIEAEAHEYRDAHRRFDRAEHLLAAEFNKLDALPQENRVQAEERMQTIVFELGRLALTENEAWLKSRRERPLTPVVG